ncbi:MAG TPA: type III polyketide synthase [Acidobacteriota bacterium]
MDQPPAVRVAAIGTANPPNCFDQSEAFALSGYPPARRRVFLNSDIETRYFWIPKHGFRPDESADQLHRRFREGALAIGELALRRCLEAAGRAPREIDHLTVATCTGYVCPALTSLLIARLEMRDDVQRADLVGMGCCGALPALQRGFDHQRAFPQHRSLVLCVEICSASYYFDDTMETLIGNAICGDGAGALLLDHGCDGPELLGFESYITPEHLHWMGFEFCAGKLRLILDREIPAGVPPLAKEAAARLLKRFELELGDVDHWILHPGGRKVIDRLQQGVGLSDGQVRHTKATYRAFGNMSSATVVFVLDRVVREARPQPGDIGLLMAMGPGFTVESALLRW